jgi:hypothetical protein
MRPFAPHETTVVSEYAEHVERRVLRLYAAIVLLLWVLGGLVWGTVTAIRIAPRPLDESVFVLLAAGGLALALLVLVLLAQLAQWAQRRVKR